MTSALHTLDKTLDPIGIITKGKNDPFYTPPPAAPPGFNSAATPGSTLKPDPTGAAPSGIFANGGAQPGYAANPWQAATGKSSMMPPIANGLGGQVRPGPSGPGATLQPAPPQPPVNAFRGGTPMPGQPPATMNGNQGMPPSGPPQAGNQQQLQQQMMIAQMLRGNPGGPPARMNF